MGGWGGVEGVVGERRQRECPEGGGKVERKEERNILHHNNMIMYTIADEGKGVEG